MHMHKEQQTKIIHTTLPVAARQTQHSPSCCLNVAYTRNPANILGISHLQRGKLGSRPRAEQALNVSMATAQGL